MSIKPKLKWLNRIIGLIAALVLPFVMAPQLMAWPYKAQIGENTVYAEQPIGPEMTRIIGEADKLTKASAIYDDGEYATDIFLSKGGWRWWVAALPTTQAFAVTRPFSNAIVVNKTDIEHAKVRLGQSQRSLASLIAHERTHGLIRHRYGFLKTQALPTKKVEGYCDYIAQESTLSSQRYREIKASGKPHRAVLYYEGRQDAIQALDVQKMTVDEFFQGQ